MLFTRKKHFLGLLVVLVLVLSACSGESDTKQIRVGSKEFIEQHVLGNMYTLLLQDAGFDAVYIPMAGTNKLHEALLADEIDLYPEYTGTGFLTVLKHDYDASMSRDEIYETVKEEYAEQYDLEWLAPTGFNNTYVLVTTQENADAFGLTTVSDLSTAASELVFGTTQEFTEREDGLPGLQEVYGGFQFKEVNSFDPGLLYAGIEDGSIDVTTGFGTDGQIAAYDLVVLEDDKGFWPPYPVAPVVRGEALEEYPEIADALDQLSALLDGDTMRSLNWEVAGNGREADEVAREFLQVQGLID